MHACIYGNMVAIVQRLYSRSSNYNAYNNIVREFVKYYKIPKELRLSVVSYMQREWNQSQGADVDEVKYS